MLSRRRLAPARRPDLEPDERMLAWAEVTDGGEVTHGVIVATNRGLWTPGARSRTGWSELHRVTWSGTLLTVVAAGVVADRDGYHIVADRPAATFELADPGRLPEQIRIRVNQSIGYTERVVLPGGGGARVVARRVSGRDGLRWVVRYDEGIAWDTPAIGAATDAIVENSRAQCRTGGLSSPGVRR